MSSAWALNSGLKRGGVVSICDQCVELRMCISSPHERPFMLTLLWWLGVLLVNRGGHQTVECLVCRQS